ncbi:hypothetical protein DV451_004634 [Geotrichum candidum]|uniref:Uncharacterized protein n=1 Tax=Geotrichum candidum TaxID=1173061 RepID=A0A9P5KS50_GEOCN|nr:hypothetical protein DV451_004634 [Geotrichum candidum]KAF5104938.1 hypothetical protein DV453_005100 [Geotrichum candidum]KAF5111661.1 hypothetical protein DV452_004372 [Geotrichum candidum]KAI8133826.1 hypothetical protein DUD61_002515 [Geotrichum candidum]KAI9210331.1 hypothetical protein DS838_004785 [Geotrichum bryndzae]
MLRLIARRQFSTALLTRAAASAGGSTGSPAPTTQGGPIRTQQKKRQRTNALQEAFKFSDDDDDFNRIRSGAIDFDAEGAPDLAHLNKRWEKLDPLEQEEIALYLEQRMRSDWNELTPDEKKAALFVSYGPWGPRTPQQPNPVKGYDIFIKIVLGLMVGVTGYQVYQGKAGYLSLGGKSDGETVAPVEEKKEN